jgi:hypothetical protein
MSQRSGILGQTYKHLNPFNKTIKISSCHNVNVGIYIPSKPTWGIVSCQTKDTSLGDRVEKSCDLDDLAGMMTSPVHNVQ